jgi:hypothetical protein
MFLPKRKADPPPAPASSGCHSVSAALIKAVLWNPAAVQQQQIDRMRAIDHVAPSAAAKSSGS